VKHADNPSWQILPDINRNIPNTNNNVAVSAA